MGGRMAWNAHLGVSKLTLVADPDSLFTEEKLAQALRERGFDLIEFNDPIAFRYAYESRDRSTGEQGKPSDLVVILRRQQAELESLPYDLRQAGRQLAFTLGECFPSLSYPVIETLDRDWLDALYEALSKSPPERLGDNATKDFILRHVFGLAAELIANDVDLLRALLRLHDRNRQLPLTLVERLVQVLRGQDGFKAWPLDEIVPDDAAFFAFLQERWPRFLDHLRQPDQVKEDGLNTDFRYPGPDILPFDHQDIRGYIDHLFVQGKLSPVEAVGIEAAAWMCSGIVPVSAEDDEVRITRLFALVEKDLPTAHAGYADWTAFALTWAELTALVHRGGQSTPRAKLNAVGDAVNATFAGWLREHYASLINQPPTNPAMLHHVPRHLAREMDAAGGDRVALIVVDGLALDQWVTVRGMLQQQDPHLLMRETATFAWIPTLTSVSRQAIFSGKPPLYFPSSIQSTHREETLWKQFLEGHGVSRLDVAYRRGLGDGDADAVLDDVIHPGKTKVVGLVVDKVDKIMHGMQLGAAGMHNQIRQWCQGGFLATLIGHLLDAGFTVWLTADHGNLECEGKGRPSEGVIAETRGERVRVYPTPELRAQVAAAFAFAQEWSPVGLPTEYFPLVAGGRDAFVNANEAIVGHGGIAIEEVIVPLVKFHRQARR